MTDLVYDPPPTCREFMVDEHLVRVIAGPVGSGKTTACIFELFRWACEQSPAPDGLRYTRFAIVRQTLQQLKMTVLKDIQTWFGAVADYRVSENTIYIEAGDVRSEWIMIPLEDPTDQKRLLSSQLTGAWMSEAIEMDVALVGPLLGRCGRYPSGARGNCTRRGVIADTNMPTQGSEWHRLMDYERPPTWGVFIQPGGLEPNAENLEWLLQTDDTLKLPYDDPRRRERGRQYYNDLLHGHSAGWVQRYVHAKYGDDPSGTAVFGSSFKADFHCVDDLEPVVGHPILIGQDFGRNPCSIICQVDHRGRLLVLEEVIAKDVGLEVHVERALRPVLQQPRYLGKPVAALGDPAGNSKSTISEETSFDALKRMGIPGFPAPTNDIDPRLRAVETWLLKQFDGQGAILIDRKRCPTLVRALSGAYKFGKTRTGETKPKPEKLHPWSDIADALQYVCLVTLGRMNQFVARHIMRAPNGVRPKRGSGGWT